MTKRHTKLLKMQRIDFCRLADVTMERAVHNDLMLGEPALGIEQCECPEQYSGLSCQVKLVKLNCHVRQAIRIALSCQC